MKRAYSTLLQRNNRSSWTKYTLTHEKQLVPSQSHKSVVPNYLSHKLSSAFLPRGYPHTVTKEYLKFSGWQFLHSVSGTITNTLSLQALLQALGLGASTAIGLAATTNWIIKDGFGLLGGVLYASLVSTKFDSHPKKFRFLAASLIQISTMIELLTPMFPHLFIFIASISNIGKNIGWLATSATRAAMNRGLTRMDNLGDVTAKSGAQSTAAGLIGTGLGIILSATLGTEPSILISVFIPLASINMWCAYKTNMMVVSRTLNLERGELAVKAYTDGIAKKQSAAIESSKQVSQREAFILSQCDIYKNRLRLEPPLDLISFTPLSHSNFLKSSEMHRIIFQNDIVNLWFIEGADCKQVLKGFLHSCIFRSLLDLQIASSSDTDPEVLLGESLELASANLDQFISNLDAQDWQTDHTHLADIGSRIHISIN